MKKALKIEKKPYKKPEIIKMSDKSVVDASCLGGKGNGCSWK